MTLPTSIKAGPGDRARRYFVGGSDARIIMGTDEVALVRLWREKRGEVGPPDYSDNLIVQLGAATEPLNRRWFEKTTGQAVRDVQTWIRHPVIRWMAATLDGIVEGTGAVYEAKFMLPWSFSEATGGREVAVHLDLFPLFGLLRPPKAYAFASPVILNEINSCRFERSADSRLVSEGNRDLPINNLGSADGCHAHL